MHDSAEFLDNTSSKMPEGEPASFVIPVIEEQLVVSRELEQRGRVRLTKHVHTHDEPLALELHHDEVTVERVAINEFVADGANLPEVRYEGDTQIIPVLREVVVTRVFIVEEIRVTKHQVTTTHTETVTLRREEVQVEHLPPTSPASPQ